MTISSDDVIDGPFVGNGVTQSFFHTFPATQESDIAVYVTNLTGLVTRYTQGNGDYVWSQVGEAGGISLVNPLPSGYTLIIKSDRAHTQETEFSSQGAFLPAVHEAAIDKLTILTSQLKQSLTETMRVPGDEMSIGELPNAASRADKILSFDSDGDPIVTDVTIGFTDNSSATSTINGIRTNTNVDLQLIYVASVAAWYELDTTDTSTTDDGVLFLIDAKATRDGTWKRINTKASTVDELKLMSLNSGTVISTDSHYAPMVPYGNLGGGAYRVLTLVEWQTQTGLTTPDGFGAFIIANGNVAMLVHEGFATLEQLGVVDGSSFQNALEFSGDHDVELSGEASFTLTSRIDLPQKFKLKSPKGSIVITADASYFSGSEFAMIYGDATTAITDSYLEGIKCIGGLTEVVADGIDRYGILMFGVTNTSVRRCEAEGLERGIILRNGTTGGELSHCDAFDCWDQGVGYIGTSALPITGVKLHNNSADMTVVSNSVSGIRTEEVYDSSIYSNKGHFCEVGLRLENSCDNTVYDNRMWECNSVGGQLYNQSHRNSVYGNHFWDNNVNDYNEVSLTPDNKGNADTRLSGFELQAGCNNNTVYGNVCYQTTGGIGHQKYGIGINIRNLTASNNRDAFNLVYGNQCFNNEIGAIEDRGLGNNVFGNTDNNFFQTIVRNA